MGSEDAVQRSFYLWEEWRLEVEACEEHEELKSIL